MRSQREHFDLAVIGGGSGGYVAAIRASQLGLRVALIEKDKLGGTCLHRGCIPSKALLQSAELYALTRHSEEFGVLCDNPRIDYAQILRRKDAIVSRLHGGIEYLMKKNKITVFKGQGQLLSPTTLVVERDAEGDVELEATDVILAAGSQPDSVPGLEFDGDRVINSDHALELMEVPSSMVILGAGPVGVEFASLYNSLGAEVTLVARRTLLSRDDREVSEELLRIFQRRGMKVFTGAKVLPETFRRHAAGVELEVESQGRRQVVAGGKLLVAVGRSGNVEGLGLEGLQVEIEKGFVKVDESMRTGEPHLYAIGDLIGGHLLAHVAMAEGIVAVETIAGLDRPPLDYNRAPRCTYCEPQVASLGLSEEQAVAQGYAVAVGRFPFRANGRALIWGQAEGFVKIVADKESEAILGVHILGPQATELIMEPALAKLLEATAWEMGSSIHAHPTLTEALGEAALGVGGNAIHI